MIKKGNNTQLWKNSRDNGRKEAYIYTFSQLLNRSSTFIVKNRSLFSTTSVLSFSPMAHNIFVSLDNLYCTIYVDFGKRQDRFELFYWSKTFSNCLDVKIKVFQRDDNSDFRMVQNLTMGEAQFNQFLQLRNQLVNEAEKLGREENLTPVLQTTMPKDMDEQPNWLKVSLTQ